MKRKNVLLISSVSFVALLSLSALQAYAQVDEWGDPIEVVTTGAIGGTPASANTAVGGDMTTDGAGNVTIKINGDIQKSLNVKGNLTIKTNSVITGDVVVAGNLTAEENVNIEGNLKVGGKIVVGNIFNVTGNIEARNSSITLKNDSAIGGGIIANGYSHANNGEVKGTITVLGSSNIVIGANTDLMNTLTASGGLSVGANSEVKLFLSGKTAIIDGKEYKLGGNVISRGANSNVGLPFVPKPTTTTAVTYGKTAVSSLPPVQAVSTAQNGQVSQSSNTTGLTATQIGMGVANQALGQVGSSDENAVANAATAQATAYAEDLVSSFAKDWPSITLPNEMGSIALGHIVDSAVKTSIKQGSFSVDTNENVSASGNQIFLTTSSGEKIPLIIPPVKVAANIGATKDTTTNMSLSLENDKPVYTITANQIKRFLGLFNVNVAVTTKADGQTGAVTSTNRPWWSFLTF